MKKAALLTLAALGAVTAAAQAQTAAPATGPGTVTTTGSINLAPDKQTAIRSRIMQQNVPAASLDGAVSLGMTVPETVQLRPLPSDLTADAPQVRDHRFFVWQNQIVLVDPQSRRVVSILR